ncbi:uncharacterized protein LOC130739404 [Lotus japonicus]|uniref:uncharacterized protein LOC130739404 n=1 Tax=Lotus japonicus TaxID=34305 RepID=UPI00258C375F|nr:uncharacterized protein LOC130739404 [Lotus japonicus]
MDSSPFQIIAWNIRGGAGARGHRRVKELVRAFRPSIFALCETHCRFARVRNFWQQQGYELIHETEATGHSGGIWLLAPTTRTFQIGLVESWEQMISVEVHHGGRRWICTAVYGSPNPVRRQDLWSYLASFRHRCQDPWLVLGDFNEVCSPSEVWGGEFNNARAMSMLNMLDMCSLIDLGFTGPKFTWERRVNGRRVMAKRLDRALGDLAWRSTFCEGYVEHLTRVYSDHAPVLVRLEAPPLERRPRPFRFQAAWVTHPSFETVVQHTWEGQGRSLKEKLSNMQEAATKFNKETFGNIHKRKWRVERRLQGVQNELDWNASESLSRKSCFGTKSRVSNG